ncbi:MAG: hypothetical protein JWO52_2112 [Gammaproteobacteria bacterium]|jgi:hypothetical protein|nr:hypothetical protein [Gammaproteobacteria bacterium]
MNSLVKVAVAGVLSLGASGAFAASLGAPWGNSSDLVLVVENASTHVAYALDTGVTLDSLLPTGSLVSGATLNTSLAGINKAISASPTLQSFLAANPAAGDVWTLEGGQYNGGGSQNASNANTKPAGAAKAVFTSANGTATNANVTTKVLTNLQAFENGLNADVTQTTGGLFPLTSSTETSAGSVSASIAENRYTFWSSLDFGSLGSSALQLFGFTGNGGTGKLQSYILGTATLDASGNLTIAGNSVAPPVPLPAAVWLFGSGLLGLFGVSRRRAASV